MLPTCLSVTGADMTCCPAVLPVAGAQNVDYGLSSVLFKPPSYANAAFGNVGTT